MSSVPRYPVWVAREVWWWLVSLFRLISRHPLGSLIMVVVLTWAVLVLEDWRPVIMSALALLTLGLWARLAPVSFHRWVTMPLFRRRTVKRVRRSWPVVLDGCRLSNRRERDGHDRVTVPYLRRLRWSDGQLIASPVLLPGQTVEDFEEASDRLRTSFHARRLRVIPNDAQTSCELVMLFGDELAQPFDGVLPALAAVRTNTVPLGITEEATVWELPVRSTLVGGSTGAGKASVMWGILIGLGPAVRAGLVELHGIDLKGGLEMQMAPRLFTRLATTPEQAVQVLEEALGRMDRRLAEMSGKSRLHTATVGAPLIIVVIDELAALIAYSTDRALVKRAEAALARLLSAGRAPGFHVLGFVQDPRKETVSMRQHFTQRFGLRLAEREEVPMVLGEGAVRRGAACHKIPRSQPGVGYVRGEDDRILRVRAGFVTDAMLRQANDLYATPRQIPITTTAPVEEPKPQRRPRARAAKADGGDGSAATDPETGTDRPKRTRRPRKRTGDDESGETEQAGEVA